jgi:phosphorylcholine metabolism protein LicD
LLGEGAGYYAFFLFGGSLSARLDSRLSLSYPRWFKSGVKGKLKSIADEIKEMDKYWNDMVFTICKGDPGQMREVVKFDIFEFFAFVENKTKK